MTAGHVAPPTRHTERRGRVLRCVLTTAAHGCSLQVELMREVTAAAAVAR